MAGKGVQGNPPAATLPCAARLDARAPQTPCGAAGEAFGPRGRSSPPENRSRVLLSLLAACGGARRYN